GKSVGRGCTRIEEEPRMNAGIATRGVAGGAGVAPPVPDRAKPRNRENPRQFKNPGASALPLVPPAKPSAVHTFDSMRRLLFPLCAIWPTIAAAQARSVDWPVYGGDTDHAHYSTLSQITPQNVGQLQVAWTYETHDESQGSEMQTNPIILDG